ncbi:hypothetical protein ERO13_D02G159366v2 [Gossypium hirsutum]|uniref:Uncharacterized protein n=2 Tax=Gossypium TaxID=3633 RepID=A0A5J5SHD9_GOSBA|nr:hypothetical protein ES319_D02G184300v1 [Gossypium barbadense]KAG4159160.1 hypothetical protein ERO13_D02G159366v2 [Gossypium hirsutum]TYG80213.1 hypothetical protein ES288_D02G198700v1 [Gossypium darwinii]
MWVSNNTTKFWPIGILIQVFPHVLCPFSRGRLSYHKKVKSITKNLPTIIRVRGGWGVIGHVWWGTQKLSSKSKDGIMAETGPPSLRWVFGLSLL